MVRLEAGLAFRSGCLPGRMLRSGCAMPSGAWLRGGRNRGARYGSRHDGDSGYSAAISCLTPPASMPPGLTDSRERPVVRGPRAPNSTASVR